PAHGLRSDKRIEVQALTGKGVGRHDARAALFLEQPASEIAGKGFACKVVVTDLVRHEQLLVEGGSAKAVTGYDLRNGVVAQHRDIGVAAEFAVVIEAAFARRDARTVCEVSAREEM